jgi:rod shape-determining protein MreB
MIRTGGMQLDEAIVAYVRKKYGIIIGQVTAEQVKIRIGAAVLQDEEQSVEIQGQDQVNGLPRPVTLTTGEIVEAIQEPLKAMVEVARRTLEKTPPELVSDIIDRGIALTGGGALLRGMDKLMTKELGVPAYLVDNPTTCVAEGAARALKMRELLRRNLPPL